MNHLTTASVLVLLPAVMALLKFVITRVDRHNRSSQRDELVLRDKHGHEVNIIFRDNATVEERAELIDLKVQELMQQRAA